MTEKLTTSIGRHSIISPEKVGLFLRKGPPSFTISTVQAIMACVASIIVEFTNYSLGGSWEDQVRLAKWLARHPGPVVISNQATERILALYREHGFVLRLLQAPRRIACTGDRTPDQEVLAVRNLEVLVRSNLLRGYLWNKSF